MEIEGNDGSKTRVKPGSTTQFGRGNGFKSTNRTVSRRHVTLQMDRQNDEPTVHFEVSGTNPIWVHSQKSGKVEIFRRFDKGEMKNGDMFCVSAENPIWFTLKKVEEDDENSVKRELGLDNDLAESLESSHGVKGVEELDIESVDISKIDPVKEFGLVVTGQDFDGYSKRIIQDARKWQWFVDEPKEESDDDEDDEDDGAEKRGTKRGRKNKKKSDDKDDDEEWTGESEEEKELLTTKPRKVQKPVYSTRSKDRTKPLKDGRAAKPSSQKKSTQVDEEDVEDVEDEDDEDETLGGFIVDDVPEEEDVIEEDDDDEEEEEEFVEDEEEVDE